MDKKTLVNLNLVSGIIFTLLYIGLFLAGASERNSGLMLGSALLYLPVYLNLMVWFKFNGKK